MKIILHVKSQVRPIVCSPELPKDEIISMVANAPEAHFLQFDAAGETVLVRKSEIQTVTFKDDDAPVTPLA